LSSKRWQKNAVLPQDICGFGDWFGIVFGEADFNFDGDWNAL
jgi:hypothetical protein